MRSRPSDSTDPLDRWEQRQQASRSSSSRMSPRAQQLAAKNATRAAATNAGQRSRMPLRKIAAVVLAIPIAIAFTVCVVTTFSGDAGSSAPTDAECVQMMQTARNTAAFFDRPVDLTLYTERGCASR